MVQSPLRRHRRRNGDGGADTFSIGGGSGRYLGGPGADSFIINDDQPLRPHPKVLHGGKGPDTYSLSSSTTGVPLINGWDR